MYKVEIKVSGKRRGFLFRGPGCLKTMLDCWYDHLDRAEAGEDICSIRVWARSVTRRISSSNGGRPAR